MPDEITRSAERRVNELEAERDLANKQRDDALVRAMEDQDEHSEQRAALAKKVGVLKTELERMRPVVEACLRWRNGEGDTTDVARAVVAYQNQVTASKSNP